MGIFDIKTDGVAFATSSATNAASIEADLRPRKNLLERILSVVCEVRPGEGLGALILTINLFTLLGAYYLLKTVRESLILAEGGAEVKAYSSAAQAIVLLGVVPLYGWIATYLNRNRLLRATTLFFASNLLIFYFVSRSGARIGVVYYIWVGIFNVFTVLSFGPLRRISFSGSRQKAISVSRSRRIRWSSRRRLDCREVNQAAWPLQIMLIAVGALCICAALTRLAGYIITKRGGELEKKKDRETLSSGGGFQLLMRDRYLMLIAILTILLNVVSLSGDFIFGKLLVDQTNRVVGTAASLMKERKAYIGAYYASYYEWTNAVTLIQTFLVSRIFKRIGVRGSMFVLPVISVRPSCRFLQIRFCR